MEILKLSYSEKDNINKLVKCLERDKVHLRNIPHQPGEFSAKPFKLTTTCEPGKKGDYYQYYNNCKQLATFENNMKTPFTDIKILKHNQVELHRFNKTRLSIHPQYEIKKSDKNPNIEKGLCFIHKGDCFWNHFFLDNAPLLYFCKSILEKDKNIKIFTKEVKFDFFHYFIRHILKLKNEVIVMKENEINYVKELYEFIVSGPFASGLFPYFAYCNCPIVLHKNLYNYIHLDKKNYKNNLLIYTKRNNGDTRTRHITNENMIENILKKYCVSNNLTYVSFFYKNYSTQDRIELFNNAKIIVGPHGAANFHTVFCKKNTKFIEFIFTKDCHSTQLVSLSYDLDYWQIPVPEHGQYEKYITISNNSIDSLKQILNQI